LSYNHIVANPTANHLHDLVERHRTTHRDESLWDPSGDHRRCPNNHRRLTDVPIRLSVHLLLIQLLPLTFISLPLALVSLPLTLVAISLIPDQSACDRANRASNQRPFGRLVLVIVPDHSSNDRTC